MIEVIGSLAMCVLSGAIFLVTVSMGGERGARKSK
jgi:hypothetical protein